MDPKDVWRDAGLYDPDDATAEERLAVLEYLTERGATIEQMVEANRMRTLYGVTADLVTQGRSEEITVPDVAARADVPAARVLRTLSAAGIPAQDAWRTGRPRLVHGHLRVGRRPRG